MSGFCSFRISEYTKQKQKHVLASSKALSEMASLGLQAAFCELNDLVVTRAYIRLLKKANTEALKSNVLSRLFLMEKRVG